MEPSWLPWQVAFWWVSPRASAWGAPMVTEVAAEQPWALGRATGGGGAGGAAVGVGDGDRVAAGGEPTEVFGVVAGAPVEAEGGRAAGDGEIDGAVVAAVAGGVLVGLAEGERLGRADGDGGGGGAAVGVGESDGWGGGGRSGRGRR